MQLLQDMMIPSRSSDLERIKDRIIGSIGHHVLPAVPFTRLNPSVKLAIELLLHPITYGIVVEGAARATELAGRPLADLLNGPSGPKD